MVARNQLMTFARGLVATFLLIPIPVFAALTIDPTTWSFSSNGTGNLAWSINQASSTSTQLVINVTPKAPLLRSDRGNQKRARRELL
jgi:hypothetical protein